ncbi:hypothetical protein CLU79DRAFT_716352 [Phycomyces nitens]|nr:hypothetical protein CLU79DRAFT_716352 [Phycomyces nitens]
MGNQNQGAISSSPTYLKPDSIHPLRNSSNTGLTSRSNDQYPPFDLESLSLRTSTSAPSQSGNSYLYRDVRATASATDANQYSRIPPPASPLPVLPRTIPTFPASDEDQYSLQQKHNLARETFKVLYAGEVTYKPDKGLLSKTKREYFVLTNNYLLRYKSQQKARADVDFFDTNLSKKPKQTFEKDQILLKLENVYATHPVVANRNSFRVEHLDPTTRQALHFTFTADSSKEADQWINTIAKTVRIHHHVMETVSPSERFGAIDRVLKHKDMVDNSEKMVIHKVIFKEKHLKLSKDNTANGVKEIFMVVLLAIGKFSMYVLPTGCADEKYIQSVDRDRHGLFSIQKIHYDGNGDTIKLLLRQTDKSSRQLVLVSTFAETIVQTLRQAVHSILPNDRHLTYTIQAPAYIKDVAFVKTRLSIQTMNVHQEDENSLRFEIILQAYCAALNLNKARFEFEINGPIGSKRFLLLPPNEVKESPQNYERSELLAVFRALRHCTFFREIDLSHQPLNLLEQWVLRKEDGWTNVPSDMPDINNMLSSELFSIISTTKTLRKLCLTDCGIGLTESPTSSLSVIGIAMCSGQIGLNQICIGENKMSPEDVHTLVSGIRSNKKAIRELDVHSTGLSQRDVETIVKSLITTNPSHLQSLDISSNNITLHPAIIDSILKYFSRLVILRIRKCSLQLRPNMFDGCKLRELDIGGNRLNDGYVGILMQWIHSPSFSSIQALHLDDCSLHGQHVNNILIAISQSRNQRMHLSIGDNPIMKEVMYLPKLFHTLMHGEGPHSLSLAKTKWEDNTLRELLDCMRYNPTLIFLDISDISIVNSTISADTIRMMSLFFERNTVMKELNIKMTGENSGLKTNLAMAITEALEGLSRNTTMERLDVTGLGWGDAGTIALANVLETNHSLSHLGLDDTKTTIAGFRVLSNAIQQNTNIIKLEKPRMDLRFQLKSLKETITGYIHSENETLWFIVHSTGSDARNVKAQLQTQVQARQVAEFNYKKINDVVDGLVGASEKNMQAHLAKMKRDQVIQAQIQMSVQEFSMAQLKLQERSARGPSSSSTRVDRIPSIASKGDESSSVGSVNSVPYRCRQLSSNSVRFVPMPSSSSMASMSSPVESPTRGFRISDDIPPPNFSYLNDFESWAQDPPETPISSPVSSSYYYTDKPHVYAHNQPSDPAYSMRSENSGYDTSWYIPTGQDPYGGSGYPGQPQFNDMMDDPGFTDDFGVGGNELGDIEQRVYDNESETDRNSFWEEKHAIRLCSNIYSPSGDRVH